MRPLAWLRRQSASLSSWIAPFPPRWLRWLAGIASLATLAVVGLAALVAVVIQKYPARGPDVHDPLDVCRRSTSGEPVAVLARTACGCADQSTVRNEQLGKRRDDLRVACDRYRDFVLRLEGNQPDARKWVRDEASEIESLRKEVLALAGPPVLPDLWYLLGGLAATLSMNLVTTHVLGKQALAAGIRPSSETGQIRSPFIAIAAITFVVAGTVTAVESLMIDKADFDSNSYCLSSWTFWLAHSSLLGLSLVVAAPLATGWYISRADHIPALQAGKFRWGVGAYVSFLEQWSFIGTLLTGATAAYWIRRLSVAPTSSAKVEVFLGFGALGVTSVILGRFVRNAFELKRRYEVAIASREDTEKVPADPTAGFLGDRWKVPAAFAAAFGITFKLLEGANVGRLLGP